MAASALTPQIGLYYPHIHFADDQWIKMAALYWDGIARIVPEHFRPRDSAVVRRFEARGFITNLPPSLKALTDVAAPFLNLLNLRAAELRERYALVQRPSGVETVEGRAVRTEILSPKLQFELDQALRSAGLAIGRPDDSGLDSVYVHPLLADVYMAALADEMARRARFQTVSGSSIDHLAASGLTLERIGQILLDLTPIALPQREVETAMAMLALRTVLPVSLDHVSVDQLMAFRQRHREELTAFQEYVAVQTGRDGPLADLSMLEDPAALEAHLRVQYEKAVVPQLRELRRALRGIGVETVYSAINVRLPTDVSVTDTLAAIGVVGTGVAAVLNPVFAIATLGLLILRVTRAKHREARDAVAAAPAAYLMFARERLTPARLLDDLGREARRLAIGV